MGKAVFKSESVMNCMGRVIKVCHMTSAHEWNDVRIFMKMCHSLREAGYEVSLVAAGVSREYDGIHVVGCGEKPVGRRARMGGFARKVYETARELDCDIYHFHDPELLPYGIKLKQAGKKVIFDSHEDVPEQIMSKYWIPVPLRWTVSRLYKAYESYAVAKFDAVVTATSTIAGKFSSRAKNVVVVNNYPRLDDIVFQTKPFEERSASICYAGGLDEIRGGKIMVDAVKKLDDIRLVLAGSCDEAIKASFSDECNISYLGIVSRKDVNLMYSESVAGIVIYQPAPNHFSAQPIKMFEFMAAGLPVIASDFPLWKKIIEDSGCGICVNPTKSDEVRRACLKLVNNRELGKKMGLAGRKYVVEKYNWAVEEKKLVNLYQSLK